MEIAMQRITHEAVGDTILCVALLERGVRDQLRLRSREIALRVLEAHLRRDGAAQTEPNKIVGGGARHNAVEVLGIFLNLRQRLPPNSGTADEVGIARPVSVISINDLLGYLAE